MDYAGIANEVREKGYMHIPDFFSEGHLERCIGDLDKLSFTKAIVMYPKLDNSRARFDFDFAINPEVESTNFENIRGTYSQFYERLIASTYGAFPITNHSLFQIVNKYYADGRGLGAHQDEPQHVNFVTVAPLINSGSLVVGTKKEKGVVLDPTHIEYKPGDIVILDAIRESDRVDHRTIHEVPPITGEKVSVVFRQTVNKNQLPDLTKQAKTIRAQTLQ